jgi:hypothetical protein
MMSSAAWSALCLVALPHHARLAVWRHPVGLPHIVVVSCEWSTGSVLHCSRLSTRLAGHDGVVPTRHSDHNGSSVRRLRNT